MFWTYFAYWVTVGIVLAIIWSYIEFVSTGKYELRLNDIPILFFAVLLWPLFMIFGIGYYTFEKFGNKSILKITRKEKK